MEEVVGPKGETRERVIHVRENRVTGLCIHLLIGLSLFLLVWLCTPLALSTFSAPFQAVRHFLPAQPTGLEPELYGLMLVNFLVVQALVIGCYVANDPTIMEHIHWVFLVVIVGSGALAHGVAKSQT